MSFEGEQIFGEGMPIKYYFVEGEINKLLIIFSASGGGYNYTRYLSTCNCHRLYIQDDYGFNHEGCWYLGENGNRCMERNTILLIEQIRINRNIEKDDVILVGSSMGGFASLYFGLVQGYKYMICGAPQIFLYRYFKYRPEFLFKITGRTDYQDESLVDYDFIISREQIREEQQVHFIVGIEDSHLPFQILPYLELINLEKKNVSLNLVEGGHNIGHTFGREFEAAVQRILANESFDMWLSRQTLEKIKNSSDLSQFLS